MASSERRTHTVLGCQVDEVTSAEAVSRIGAWAARHESRYVCICNAHMTVTAAQDPSLRDALDRADMVTPDGAPVAWMLRRIGARQQRRVTGPDLMLDYCAHAAAAGESIFLYGSTPETLEILRQQLRHLWPHLLVAGQWSPPFRPATADEDEADIERINASGARTVWVALGCPKQERWMAEHRGRIHAVMIGVGAAFSFHAGVTPRAPMWMRQYGFEWLHRLISEPRRLWRRYLVTNTAFMLGALKQLVLGR